MMKKEAELPKPVETYIRTINARDADAFQSCFAHDAVVSDVGREIRGIAAIKEWANHEIFAVNVTLEVMGVAERDGETIVTVKIDGTFDRTGLPDPLLMDHCFTVAGDKIAALTCRLAPSRASTSYPNPRLIFRFLKKSAAGADFSVDDVI